MVSGKSGRAFWIEIIWLAAVFWACLLGGCASSNIPDPSRQTEMTPAFALPCGATNTCAALDPCADRGFDRCADFKAPGGLVRRQTGTFGTAGYRAQAVDRASGKPVSLWHDIPLIVSDDGRGLIVNAYFEVSKGLQAKVELNKWEAYNPIWQDSLSLAGQGFARPRYYGWSPAPGNYGALPRTWENVLAPDPLTGFPGDTDPIDVVDIGAAAAPIGIVYPVKVLGALGMIDGTDLQTDWKIFVINTRDPRAQKMNDISDIPGKLKSEWGLFWRFYKTARGLAQNFFFDPAGGGFSADPVWLGAAQARRIIDSSAAAYRQMTTECLNRRLSAPFWVPGCSP